MLNLAVALGAAVAPARANKQDDVLGGSQLSARRRMSRTMDILAARWSWSAWRRASASERNSAPVDSAHGVVSSAARV